jgi:iron complex outermembrane receptor protein
LNIISPTTGPLNWILGGYYQHNHGNVHIQNRSAVPTDPTNITTFNDKRTYGGFAQAGYKVVPNVEIELGMRYSRYRVEQTGSVVIGAGTAIFGPSGRQVANLASNHRDGRLTGKAAINWQVDPDNLIYAFAARGYKPGGANSSTSQFGPETVWDYELGWKSTMLDNHLRTQLGAFYMNYHGFQFDSLDISSGTSGVANVSNATIKGVEFQAQAKLHGFNLDGGVAYVDSHLGSLSLVDQRRLPQIGTLGPQCAAGVNSTPPTCFNYLPYIATAGGGENLFSPKWTFNAGVDYKFMLSSETSLTPRVNYAYLSSRYTYLFYSPVRDYLPGRGLVSALLTLRHGKWSIEGYANNLTNKRYVSGQFGLNEFYGPPREFGARGSLQF